MSRGVLVAGIGNIFQTDDGFGVAVADRLASRDLPPWVRVEDFGIRGLHLAYELLDGYEALVMIDAVPMNSPPGTLAVIDPEINSASHDAPVLDAHTMSPDMVLANLSRLGGSVGTIRIVGCQPASLRDGLGLTPPVEAAIEGAVDLCLELLADIVHLVGKGITP